MKIKRNNQTNPELAKQAQEVRTAIVSAAEKNSLPSRFKVKPSKTSPSMIITDSKTGKKTKVPLFAYGEVRKALTQLFGQ